MTRIAVLSHKGGVGKTITAANVAGALAVRGLSVLMVDFDPQADLSASWGVEEDHDAPRIEALLAAADGRSRAGAIVDVTPPACRGRLGLLAAGGALRAQTGPLIAGPPERLSALLDGLAHGIDVTLIDTPAGETIFGAQAMVAASQVIVPLLPGYHELRALTRVLDGLDRQTERLETDISLLGVLVVNADLRWRTTREYRAHLDGEAIPLFDGVVPRRQAVTGHARYGQPTVLLDPDHAVAAAYQRVADEVIVRLGRALPHTATSTSHRQVGALA